MYLAHYTKRFIPEFDAECRVKLRPIRGSKSHEVLNELEQQGELMNFLSKVI